MYIIKDTLSVLWFLMLFAILVFFIPNTLGHPDNYIPANADVTPEHIVPEWYFLPFYAILRSIPDKAFGVLAMLMSILALFILPFIHKAYARTSSFKPMIFLLLLIFASAAFLLGYVGGKPIEYPFISLGQVLTITYFSFFILIPIVESADSALVRHSIANTKTVSNSGALWGYYVHPVFFTKYVIIRLHILYLRFMFVIPFVILGIVYINNFFCFFSMCLCTGGGDSDSSNESPLAKTSVKRRDEANINFYNKSLQKATDAFIIYQLTMKEKLCLNVAANLQEVSDSLRGNTHPISNNEQLGDVIQRYNILVARYNQFFDELTNLNTTYGVPSKVTLHRLPTFSEETISQSLPALIPLSTNQTILHNDVVNTSQTVPLNPAVEVSADPEMNPLTVMRNFFAPSDTISVNADKNTEEVPVKNPPAPQVIIEDSASFFRKLNEIVFQINRYKRSHNEEFLLNINVKLQSLHNYLVANESTTTMIKNYNGVASDYNKLCVESNKSTNLIHSFNPVPCYDLVTVSPVLQTQNDVLIEETTNNNTLNTGPSSPYKKLEPYYNFFTQNVGKIMFVTFGIGLTAWGLYTGKLSDGIQKVLEIAKDSSPDDLL